MPYKVLINKCNDGQRARAVAAEIARWSGSKRDIIYRVLTEKTICIKRNASFEEAQKLRTRFERLGAVVELVSVTPVSSQHVSDDDEEEVPGRILTDEEYYGKIRERDDIFYLDNNRRLRNTELVCLLCGIIFGIFLSTREIIPVDPDFIEPVASPSHGSTQVLRDYTVDRPHPVEEKPKEIKISLSQKRSIKRNARQGANGTRGGGGDIRARVTAKGLLGIINGKIAGKPVASADPFGKGGFTENIDAILSGLGGLKTGGNGGAGRKGAVGIGFGKGYGNGFGGEMTGMADLLDNLFGTDNAVAVSLKKRDHLIIKQPGEIFKGGALAGGRNKIDIARVVQQNIAALRHAYNRRLREKPGLKGKITVTFAIDEFGNVLFCKLTDSTMSDSVLETLVLNKIKRWKFEKIDKVGDVTEVVYPFVFAM